MGSVCKDEDTIVSLEEHTCSLAVGFVEHPRPLERGLADRRGLLLKLVHCALRDRPELEQQPTHQGRLPRVDVTSDDAPQSDDWQLLQGHRALGRRRRTR